MKNCKSKYLPFIPLSVFGAILFSSVSAQQMSDAYITPINQTQAVITVNLRGKDEPVGKPGGTLILNDGKIQKYVSPIDPPPNPQSNYSVFQIPVPVPVGNTSYEIALTFDANGANGQVYKAWRTLPVVNVVNTSVLRDPPNCNSANNIQLIFITPVVGGISWGQTQKWIKPYEKPGSTIANVDIVQKNKLRTYDVIMVTTTGAAGNLFPVCLALDHNLPSGTFDANVNFTQDPQKPAEIDAGAVGKDLSGPDVIHFPTDEVQDAPENRKLENTIDVASSFTSSVETEDVPATASSPASTVRRRKNVGILDLGFEYPEVLHPIYEANKWMTFLTPLFVKASISTGKIEKDTLSQNRILFGFLGESRYRKRKKEGEFVSIHRIEWGVTHASDRDFKQKEIYASISYKPLFDALYRPYDLNLRTSDHEPKGWGVTFAPSVGFDFGRTYSRRNPAPAIEPGPFIRRLNFGVQLSLDLTSHISLSAEYTAYIRWEATDGLLKNQFKAQGEFKLNRWANSRLAQSVFVTYEKGQAPPFASPAVNSVRIGYRIIGDFCGVHCR